MRAPEARAVRGVPVRLGQNTRVLGPARGVCVVALAFESNGTSVRPYHAKPASSADDVEMARQLLV